MSSRQPGPCLWCESTDVHQIQWGQPAGAPAEGLAATSDPPAGPRRQFVCRDCGRTWSHLPLKTRRGEVVETERGPIKATATDVQLLDLLTEDCARRGEPSLSTLVEGVPETPDEASGPSTEIISQADIDDLLAGAYGETEHRDEPNPAPEPA